MFFAVELTPSVYLVDAHFNGDEVEQLLAKSAVADVGCDFSSLRIKYSHANLWYVV